MMMMMMKQETSRTRHNHLATVSHAEVQQKVSSMTRKSWPHRCGCQPGWRRLMVLHLNILGLVIISAGLAICMPSPIIGGLDRHEGLLVDLIKEQQKDFLLQLKEIDRQAKQPIGNTNSDSKWIPSVTIEQLPISSSAGRDVGPAQLDSPEPGQMVRPNCNQTRSSGSWPTAESRPVQTKGWAPEQVMVPTGKRTDHNNDRDDDDDDDDGEDFGHLNHNGVATQTNRLDESDLGDLLDARESVSLESSLIPPPLMGGDEEELPQSSDVSGNEEGPEGSEQSEADNQDLSGQNESATGQTPEAEAAERREQEAAEASEAEAANKSALAEQQQQQREIIKAQAQNEAEAIRQQQNALLKQQQLQHQILMNRDQELLEGEAKTMQDRRKTKIDIQRQKANRYDGDAEHPSGSRRDGGFRMRAAQNTNRQQVRRKQPHRRRFNVDSSVRRASEVNQDEAYLHPGSDTQFSDQPDNRIANKGAASSSNLTPKQSRKGSRGRDAAQSNDDAHSGFIRSRFEPVIAASSNHNRVLYGNHFNSTNSTDLIAAAQNYHDYGLHFGMFNVIHGGLEGYHFDGGHYKKKPTGYYQYIKSHKKGQFDSGFKRGNHKSTISGHSSQHKGHAKGYVKWKGTKGKGDHHWEYKHKNKKRYGSGGFGLGGGGHYYL